MYMGGPTRTTRRMSVSFTDPGMSYVYTHNIALSGTVCFHAQ